VKIPQKLRSRPADEILAWYRERERKESERRKRERACDYCGKRQLHWDRRYHPTLGGPKRLYLVNRYDVIHECKSKFKVRIVKGK